MALRQIACSAAWRTNGADLAEALTPAVLAILPAAIEQAHALTAPALRSDFKRLVSPTLTLCMPAGMNEGDVTAWLATAAETLSGIPADLLEWGCRAAREKADHPAKIVPAIMAVAKRPWDERKGDLNRLLLMDRVSRGEEERKPWDPVPFDPSTICTPEAAQKIIDEMNLHTEARPKVVLHDRPARKPARADYLALGVPAADLDRMGIGTPPAMDAAA